MALPHFLALAVDYDGTIAHDGKVSESTLAALKKVKESGRKVILVTGREKPDLEKTFEHLDVFDYMVLENGAQLINPEKNEKEIMGKAPPSDFIRALEEKGVPFSLGKVILATWEPHEQTVLETIKELGLDLQVIFNKGAVMVLPSSVNKASGLKRALEHMGISPINVVGVGDAENDHSFLNICGCSAAVSNALPKLKERVDIVLQNDHGAGVEELAEAIIADDLRSWSDRLERHAVRIGKTGDGMRVSIPSFGANILVAGTSGGGKSTLTTGLMERFVDQNNQFCIIDPEGDHDGFEDAMILGSGKRPPSVDEVMNFFQNIDRSVIVDLLGQPLQERPSFFLRLLPKLIEHREKTGRPHWIIVDEAHHMLPGPWDFESQPFPKDLQRMVYITLEPDNLPPTILKTIDIIIAVGDQPEHIIENFCKAAEVPMPDVVPSTISKDQALVWMRTAMQPPVVVERPANRSQHRRHSRKYAEGELNPERSFYFRGPEKKLNLRAQNVLIFLQIAEGVDDETLMYHFREGHFSEWFGTHVKDNEVGEKMRQLEKEKDLTRDKLLERMHEIIEETYTLPPGHSWTKDKNTKKEES
jgi:HAD superfamily hydrolase (TIGR01484 family)